MNNHNDWKVVSTKKNRKRTDPVTQFPINNNIIPPNIINIPINIPIDMPIDSAIQINELQIEELQSQGQDIELNNEYTLWCHSVKNKNWGIESYKKISTIKNVSEFWRLYNNMFKLSFRENNFFLMNSDTEPIWEDPNNRNGGICSFKIVNPNIAINVFNDLCCHMVCNRLILNGVDNDINGVSFCPKNNWVILKIWNKDRSNNLATLLNPELIAKYKDYNIQYTPNKPEY